MSSLFVAFSLTLASIFFVSPISRVKSSAAVISVTGVFTVTGTVTDTFGLSSEVIVISVSPSPTAVTFPFSSTVTISGFFEVYISFLLVASSLTETSSVVLFFSSSFLSRTIPSSGTLLISVTGFLTVTVIVSLFVGSSMDLTVTVAVPSPTAVILPYLSTVTTSGLLDS